MKCLGILWNSMDPFKEEALDDIGNYCKILGCFSIDLKDDYENFVRDIYSQDDIAEWKVDRKLETMFACSESRKVHIILMDVKTNEQEYHPLKKRMVFKNLEQMKVNIRAKYKEKVNTYFFDNVFHVTDDSREFIADYSIVKKYADKEYGKRLVKVLNKRRKDLNA